MSTVTAREEAFTFGCEGEALLGLLHHPATDAPAQAAQTGVVVIVGGPQYRAGSHRQFVHLARALAAAGHPVLRFDVRGMGDSTGALRNFEHITPDVGAAIDALVQRAPAVRRVMLWGLCDGASAALLYLHDRQDERVQGLCLLNPWVRSEASLARTHVKHYYMQRLLAPSFWRKLLSGGLGLGALHGLRQSLGSAIANAAPDEATQAYQLRMASGLAACDGSVIVVLSGRDYTAKEFVEFTSASAIWPTLLRRPSVQTLDVPEADHTFSGAELRHCIESITQKWLARSEPPAAGTVRPPDLTPTGQTP